MVTISGINHRCAQGYDSMDDFNQLLSTLEELQDPTKRLKIVKTEQGSLSIQAESKPVIWGGKLFEKIFGKRKTRQGKNVHVVLCSLFEYNADWLKKKPLSELYQMEAFFKVLDKKFARYNASCHIYYNITPYQALLEALDCQKEEEIQRAVQKGKNKAEKKLAKEISAQKRIKSAYDQAAQTFSLLGDIESLSQEVKKTSAAIWQEEKATQATLHQTHDLEEKKKETVLEAQALDSQTLELNHQADALLMQQKILLEAEIKNQAASDKYEQMIKRQPFFFDMTLQAKDGQVQANRFYLSQIPGLRKWLKKDSPATLPLCQYSIKTLSVLNDYCLGKAKAFALTQSELKELIDCAKNLEYKELQQVAEALLAKD
jgi:hypothetical protein